jgi:putative membrane protein
MHEWNGDWMGGWMWIGWAIGMALIVGLLWLGVRGMAMGGSSASAGAEEVLRRRFARGEIDEEEYQRRLEALRR